MNDERTLQEAARQRARLLAHDCTDAEREQMQAWQARSPANRRAAALAERVVTDIERLGSDERLQSKLRALADEALAARGVAPAVEQAAERDARQQRRRVFVGLAASAVMCMLAWQLSPRIMSTEAEPLVYETGAQERRRPGWRMMRIPRQ